MTWQIHEINVLFPARTSYDSIQFPLDTHTHEQRMADESSHYFYFISFAFENEK